MDPQTVFCPNLDCPARGQTGKGNIHVHSLKEHRYLCDVCAKTLTETKGTVFYRLRHDTEQVTLVRALLAHGCPVCAIVFAFGLDERTVRNWEQRAGITANRYISIWFNSRVTWVRCKPTKFASKCKRWWSGLRWSCKSRRACGLALP